MVKIKTFITESLNDGTDINANPLYATLCGFNTHLILGKPISILVVYNSSL